MAGRKRNIKQLPMRPLTSFFKKTRLEEEGESAGHGEGEEMEESCATATASSSASGANFNVSNAANDMDKNASRPVEPPPQPTPPTERPLPSAECGPTPPTDLSAVEEPATQPKLAVFPATLIDRKPRSFSVAWYDKFKWIEYSQSRDAIFCKACRHFPEAHDESTFIRDGFKKWKRTGQACEKHDQSKQHCMARCKMDAYRQSHGVGQQSRGTVLNQMHGDSISFVERNRQHVKAVLDVVMMCAKLEIPLRGHRETAESLNKGRINMFYIAK